MRIPDKLKSRKLWAAILAGLVVALNRFFELGLTEADINKIVTALVSYIFVEGGADLVSRIKG